MTRNDRPPSPWRRWLGALARTLPDLRLLAEERFRRANAEALAALLLSELEVAEAHPVTGPLPDPLPPIRLRGRVGHHYSAHGFLEFGRARARDVERLVRAAGVDPGTVRRVLDFGCGCGRVTRHLPEVFPSARFAGADVDPEAVAWCSTHLSRLGTFQVVPERPPAAVEGGPFDLILALSVFTHLPAERERLWRRELARIAGPGSLLVLTFLDDDVGRSEGFRPETALEREDGFSHHRTAPTPGLPDWYQASFHSEDAIRRRWGEDLEILSIHPRSVNGRQSAVLCRARATR